MKCIGCGAIVADLDHSSHPYIGASPGCWAVYGDVLGREYGEFNYPECHRQTVDAYAAQHPGTPSRHSIQSVAMNLIGLHFAIERNLSSKQITQSLRLALQSADSFRWLDPPSFEGRLTVHDVASARDLAEHAQRVNEWAVSVWQAWAPHHETVRRWVMAMRQIS